MFLNIVKLFSVNKPCKLLHIWDEKWNPTKGLVMALRTLPSFLEISALRTKYICRCTITGSQCIYEYQRGSLLKISDVLYSSWWLVNFTGLSGWHNWLTYSMSLRLRKAEIAQISRKIREFCRKFVGIRRVWKNFLACDIFSANLCTVK
jgi:hypothetical protein